jgi:hypothetical protein
MNSIKNIYENKYIKLYFFIRAWLIGVGNNSKGDIYFYLPFFIVILKRDNISFVRKYGEVVVILLMVWFTIIFLSRIFY